SAITVCALPSSDLQTTPTFTPEAAASMAARSPAPPAPITSTSYEYVEYSATLEDSPIGPDAHRAEANVDIGEAHGAEARPGPFFVVPVETTHAIVKLVPHGMFRDLVEGAANQVAEGVAAEHIAADQNHVDGQNDRAQSDAEMSVEPERLPYVVYEKSPHEI